MDISKVLGWVLSSKYRTSVLQSISSFTMPSEIVEKTQFRFSHVSRALAELTKKNLVELQNPGAKKGRLYVLTEDGKKIRRIIDNRDK